MATEIAAVPIRDIPNADTNATGSFVLVEIETGFGSRRTLAFPVDLLDQFAATLAAGAQKAQRMRGEKDPLSPGAEGFVRALTNPPITIGHEQGAVILSLLPQGHLPLRFAFSPDHARAISERMREVAVRAASADSD